MALSKVSLSSPSTLQTERVHGGVVNLHEGYSCVIYVYEHRDPSFNLLHGKTPLFFHFFHIIIIPLPFFAAIMAPVHTVQQYWGLGLSAGFRVS